MATMMKTKHSLLIHCIAAVFTALMLAACGGGGGGGGGGSDTSGDAVGSSAAGSSSTGGCTLTSQEIAAIDNINDFPPECLVSLPAAEDNLLGRMFVLGTRVDVGGDLRIFVSGTDADGNPLQLADFQTATVSILGSPADPGQVSVSPVTAGDKVLSLGFITDYSTSISDAELDTISTVYSLVLDSLPPVFEGAVINFSSAVNLQQDWIEDTATLRTALQRDNAFVRDRTALYDAIGFSLQRDLGDSTDGLIERRRPAHMQVLFTDGEENASFQYTRDTLLPIINDSQAVMIMLGGLNADKDLLVELAGDRGAFVYAYDLASIENTVQNWAASLGHMVVFTLDSATGFGVGGIRIELGSDAVMVERPTDGFCQYTP